MQCSVNNFICYCCIALHLYKMSCRNNFRKRLCNPCSASHFIVLPINFTHIVLCRAHQSKIHTNIMCKSQQSILVESLFCGAQNHKSSTRKKHTIKAFVKTEVQKFWWRNSKCYDDSHDGWWEGDPMNGAMMPPWWHACIPMPRSSLSPHVMWR